MDEARAGRAARTTLLVLAIVVLAAAAGVAGYASTRSARASETSPTAAAPPAYGSATAPLPSPSAPSPPPASSAAVQRALSASLASSGAGGRVVGRIVDARTGAVVLDRSGATPTAPASTAKLTTAYAVLTVHEATDRITTTVVTDGRGTVALVGAGDPTLSAAPKGQATGYPQAARLSELAAQVMRAGVPVRRIVVDGRRFGGPGVSPNWAAEDVPSSYGSAITAVMADGGRAAPGDTVRSAQPDLAAGRSFAALLGRGSVPVSRGAVSGGRTVARVRSAPIGTLVAQMLQNSDNVIAECLARQVALAERGTASFTAAASAVRTVLRDAGLDPGAGLVDGSGLAPRDRLAPAYLARVLHAAATSDRAAVRTLVAGLPVAAWSGSLAARYVSGSARSAAGLARAKTGTLTGVSALAGYVPTARGRLLAFSLVADRNTSTPAAEAALDAVVARIASCRC